MFTGFLQPNLGDFVRSGEETRRFAATDGNLRS
jgi:hypothetical protein